MVATDIKMNDGDFVIADRESSLYSILGVTVGDDNFTWPLLIAVPGTTRHTGLQLHVVVPESIWNLTIATGDPWDRWCFTMHIKCSCASSINVSSQVFHSNLHHLSEIAMDKYSIKGLRNRVFLNKKTGTVHKFYDTQWMDFFTPPSQ